MEFQRLSALHANSACGSSSTRGKQFTDPKFLLDSMERAACVRVPDLTKSRLSWKAVQTPSLSLFSSRGRLHLRSWVVCCLLCTPTIRRLLFACSPWGYATAAARRWRSRRRTRAGRSGRRHGSASCRGRRCELGLRLPVAAGIARCATVPLL
jgi:hypothetical protein